jgi:hypothetical protein
VTGQSVKVAVTEGSDTSGTASFDSVVSNNHEFPDKVDSDSVLGESDLEDDDAESDLTLDPMILPSCQQHVAGERNVVVLFGGPGTHKGEVTDVMVKHYKFHVISMEDLLLRHGRKSLAKKNHDEDAEAERKASVANTNDIEVSGGESVHGMENMFGGFGHGRQKSTSSKGETHEIVSHLACSRDIEIAGLLRMAVDEMDCLKDKFTNFVIDLMPNHRELILSKIFQSSAKVLARFDRSEIHVRFAIILENKVVGDDIDVETRKLRSRDAKKEDEQDVRRTSRRSQAIYCSSEPFVHIFEVSQRVIRIPCQDMSTRKVVKRFQAIMTTMGFVPSTKKPQQVFLALTGVGKSECIPRSGVIQARSIVGTGFDGGDQSSVRLLDVLDALPRRLAVDASERSTMIVVDFSGVDVSTAECLRMGLGVEDHPCIDDPHLAKRAFHTWSAPVFGFAIGAEIELFLPNTTESGLCAAIVSRLAYRCYDAGSVLVK